jgi:hypothetical protein
MRTSSPRRPDPEQGDQSYQPYQPGTHYRVTGRHACLMARVALGVGRFAGAPLNVEPGCVLECAGLIVGDGGPVVGWKLSAAQREQAEAIVRPLSRARGFCQPAAELVEIGASLEQLVEPVPADG